MLAKNSTASVRADPETPAPVRTQLELVDQTLYFAATLGLDVGGRYTSYVEWPGDRVVTTVVATRPGEIEPAGFDYPIVGRAPYRGFFDIERAERFADELRERGLDVCLSPVTAYSTLGWFDDPVTTPMLGRSDASLVETIVHELVHATIFVADQPEFNESSARFIGQEGSVLFFATRDPAESVTGRDSRRDAAVALARARIEENRQIDDVLLGLRAHIQELYAEEPESPARVARREALEAEARAALAALPLDQHNAETLAGRIRLGDACLALRGTYTGDGPRYAAVLASLGGDLPAFIDRLRVAADQPDPRAAFFAISGDGS
jgi:predicted aminopeptidase